MAHAGQEESGHWETLHDQRRPEILTHRTSETNLVQTWSAHVDNRGVLQDAVSDGVRGGASDVHIQSTGYTRRK